MTDVVVAAGGASWESEVLPEIESAPSLRLVRRCVDVAELLALGPTAVAEVAFVATDLVGLDADAVFRLQRDGVRVVGIGTQDRCSALGIGVRAEPGALEHTVETARSETLEASGPVGADTATASTAGARTIAVWGPSGAPGRSTVATSAAAALAHRGRDTVLVDADTYGGSIAQMVAVLDDVSGLMAACRAANQGRADESSSHLVDIEPRLRLLSGIPRADMWPQVRPGALQLVLRHLQAQCDVVVVDCAAPLEPGQGTSGSDRNQVTRHLLDVADEILVVGRADPVGLSRLVRALHDLGDTGGTAPTVVVNQLRSSLGWTSDEVAETLTRLTGTEPATFLPSDVSSLDLAVMRGRLPRHVASGSPFVVAVDALVESLDGAMVGARAR